MNNTFKELSAVNVNDHIEKKGNLSYLSWPYAYKSLMAYDPDASFKVKHYPQGDINVPYMKTEEGYLVETSLTVKGETKEMWLPVMDNRNRAVKQADMMQINKTIMRCLVKNMSLFGLGLYIYAGEDLPEQQKTEEQLKQYAELRTELNNIGCDFRDANVDSYICKHAKVKTQDIQKLDAEGLSRLIKIYKEMIEKKNETSNK